jgi:hypothetical protein
MGAQLTASHTTMLLLTTPQSGEDVGCMDQPSEPTQHACIWSRHSREDKEFA